ncbi:MAG: ATP-binding protein [Gemmatimonadota bacterium]
MNRGSASRRSDADASGPEHFVLELPSDLRVIEAAVGYLVGRCRAASFQGPRLDLNFRVGVTEALANAVLYGNARDPRKTVKVEVSLEPNRVVVSVADEGTGFDPGSIPDPTRPENLHAAGGRGLFLIRNLMDEMQYNERGNALRMVLLREVPPSRTGRASG